MRANSFMCSSFSQNMKLIRNTSVSVTVITYVECSNVSVYLQLYHYPVADAIYNLSQFVALCVY